MLQFSLSVDVWDFKMNPTRLTRVLCAGTSLIIAGIAISNRGQPIRTNNELTGSLAAGFYGIMAKLIDSIEDNGYPPWCSKRMFKMTFIALVFAMMTTNTHTFMFFLTEFLHDGCVRAKVHSWDEFVVVIPIIIVLIWGSTFNTEQFSLAIAVSHLVLFTAWNIAVQKYKWLKGTLVHRARLYSPTFAWFVAMIDPLYAGYFHVYSSEQICYYITRQLIRFQPWYKKETRDEVEGELSLSECLKNYVYAFWYLVYFELIRIIWQSPTSHSLPFKWYSSAIFFSWEVLFTVWHKHQWRPRTSLFPVVHFLLFGSLFRAHGFAFSFFCRYFSVFTASFLCMVLVSNLLTTDAKRLSSRYVKYISGALTALIVYVDVLMDFHKGSEAACRWNSYSHLCMLIGNTFCLIISCYGKRIAGTSSSWMKNVAVSPNASSLNGKKSFRNFFFSFWLMYGVNIVMFVLFYVKC